MLEKQTDAIIAHFTKVQQKYEEVRQAFHEFCERKHELSALCAPFDPDNNDRQDGDPREYPSKEEKAELLRAIRTAPNSDLAELLRKSKLDLGALGDENRMVFIARISLDEAARRLSPETQSENKEERMREHKTLTQVQATASEYLRKAGLNDVQVAMLATFGYFRAPASRGRHLCRPGGLAEHSINVTDQLLALRVFDNDQSAYKVGMLHDLVKCYTYAYNPETVEYEKRATKYPGHGMASALLCADLGLDLTIEERAAIVWHMVAFDIKDRDTNDAYDRAQLLFPRQVVLTHAADHLAAALENAAEREDA